MKITVGNQSQGSGPRVTETCPHCGRDVTFNATLVSDLHVPPNYWLGQRYCPNPKCLGHIFFINENDKSIRLYPPSRIKFDSSKVPEPVMASLNEAIDCHAHKNFRASAVMIRRAIDHICKDKGAEGKDLDKRIEALKEKVILPSTLFDGMHKLRMLGNDAAHTEAKVFDEIGDTEVEVGIQFAKRITEAIYQYSELLEKLNGLTHK